MRQTNRARLRTIARTRGTHCAEPGRLTRCKGARCSKIYLRPDVTNTVEPVEVLDGGVAAPDVLLLARVDDREAACLCAQEKRGAQKGR